MCDDPHDSASANTLQVVSLKIFGEPASKANSRRVVRIGGMSRLIKSQKALTYSELFQQQTKRDQPLIHADVRVTMHIWYASRRPDLDESLILDLLQGVAYVNDRQVKEKHIYWHLDPAEPRTEIVVEELPMPKKKPRSRSSTGLKG
jgi:Holliday junction resolvase RusA-like endonuclease